MLKPLHVVVCGSNVTNT